MASLMKWRQPQAAVEWEWQQAKVELRRLGFTFLKWYIPLAALTAYIVYRVSPSELRDVVQILVGLTIFLPAWFLLVVWLATKTKTIYEVMDRGLFRRSDKSFFYPWSRIEGYRFADHPGVPGLRSLEIKVRRFKKWRRWAFDSAEVDESALREIMEKHLPGKCSDGLTDGD